MPPKSASSYPPEPWYFREFPFDKPHKEAGLGDGGTAKAEVFLGKAWHVVEFRMDGDVENISLSKPKSFLSNHSPEPTSGDWYTDTHLAPRHFGER